MSELKWVSVFITKANAEELNTLVGTPYVKHCDILATYVVAHNHYVFCDRIAVREQEIILPTFELLDQILFLNTLGLSTEYIRESLNIPIREEDYA